MEPVTRIQASEVKEHALLGPLPKPRAWPLPCFGQRRAIRRLGVEHLVGLGRRNATERMAHFLLELGARLKLLGLADQKGYRCPLSQYLLADALGLSAVHVNRVLREEGLLTFQKGKVLFQNYEALVGFSGGGRAYLDQEGPLLR